MLENGRLSGILGQIKLYFVEQEATGVSDKLSIQLQLSGLSLSNTVGVVEVFGVQRARSTVHNWVHKADLQPESGKNLDHVAVDETVIQLNDEQYWLYAAVDPESNRLLHTGIEPTTNTVIAQTVLAKIDEKHAVSAAVFLVDGSHSLQAACHRAGYDFRYEKHGTRNTVERVLREIKRRTICISNCFSNTSAETADNWINSFSFAWKQLSEHYDS